MKLFGIEIRRDRTPHASYELVSGRPSSPVSGAVGTDSEYGQIVNSFMGGDDVNPDLVGSEKYARFREMLTTDPVVRSVSWLYKLPIRSADWLIEPATDDGVDELIAELCRDQFGLEGHAGWLDLTWDGWLQQSLKFLDYGSMFEELIWADPRKWNPTGGEGEPRIIRPLARLAPRSPASIEEIEDDSATGQIKRIRQVLGNRWIDGEKVQHYVFEKDAGSWWGNSLLRPMNGAWKIKKEILVAAAIAFDRFAAGTVLVWHPDGKKAEAEKIARNLRFHEEGYAVFQGRKDEGDWEIDILNGSGTAMDPVPMLRLLDVQIATAGLQQFTQLGNTETGSRATAVVHADAFYLAVQAVAKQIVEDRTRQVLRRFVTVNFGEEYAVPKLKVTKIQARNIPMLVAAIRDLSTAGFNFTDRDTQNDLRDQLDLRHLPEALQRAIGELPDEAGIELNPTRLPQVPREGDALAA